jgi:hypothetical protein
MFLNLQVPLADSRPFVQAESHRLEHPVWSNPRPDKEFVRGFGSMVARARGGIEGLDFEGNYCSATKALRFPLSLSTQSLKAGKAGITPICVFRRFISDGKSVGRFEVGIRHKNKPNKLNSSECTELLASLLKLKVSIPSGKRQNRFVELGQCGRDIANWYLCSTTKIAQQKVLSREDWWVVPGSPLIILECNDAEVEQVPKSARQVKRFSGENFSLYRDHMPYRGSVIGVWILQLDDKAQPDFSVVRNLRICLSRLHTERECLKETLRLLSQSQYSSKLAVSSFCFQKYLRHSIELLMKTRRYGFDQYVILEAAQEFDSALTPGERDTILSELSNLSIGREIIGGLRKQQELRQNYQTTVQLGSGSIFEMIMGDQYKAGQAGALGPGAHAQDMNFQQIWNDKSNDLDLGKLAKELSSLRCAMKKESVTLEHDRAVGEIAAAEEAASKGEGIMVLRRLAAAGKWALDVATQIRAGLVVEVLRSSLRM